MIRAAVPGDALAIAAIWNPVITDTARTFTNKTKDPADIAALIAERPFWVAQRDDDIVGFASYGPFRGGPGYAHTVEHSVYVSQTARGLGLGRALMAACEAHARAAGVHVMVAGIGGESPDGVAFHAALGFREVGRLPEVGRKFDRWQDLILMHKFL